MSAQIIQHPHFARDRVVQTRTRGRLPKAIASFRRAQYAKLDSATYAGMISREVEALTKYLELNQLFARYARYLLDTLRRTDLNQLERVVLARKLRVARQEKPECWTGQEVVIASEFVRWSEGLPSRLQ